MKSTGLIGFCFVVFLGGLEGDLDCISVLLWPVEYFLETCQSDKVPLRVVWCFSLLQILGYIIFMFYFGK